METATDASIINFFKRVADSTRPFFFFNRAKDIKYCVTGKMVCTYGECSNCFKYALTIDVCSDCKNMFVILFNKTNYNGIIHANDTDATKEYIYGVKHMREYLTINSLDVNPVDVFKFKNTYKKLLDRKICDCGEDFIDDNDENCLACALFCVEKIECSICRSIIPKKRFITAKPCGHEIHEECYNKLTKCPFCRKKFVK